MKLFETTADRPATFARGFTVVFVPLLLLVLPLFFHRSEAPEVLGWDAAYLRALVVIVLLAVGAALFAGWRSGRTATMDAARRLFLFVVVGFLCLVVLELFLRTLFGDAFATYRMWGQKKSTIYTYEAAPSHAWEAFGGTYTTDHEGFRTHASDPGWRDGEHANLVFAVGGSSVFGFGLDDDATWPHLLEKELGGAATVVNAGNNGHASLQLMMRLYLKVLAHRPSHVVYYGSVNDVYDRGNDVDKIEVQGEIALAPSQAAYLAAKYRHQNFWARTVLAHLIRKKLPRLAAAAFGDTSELPSPDDGEVDRDERSLIQENGRRFARNLRTMADMCRRAGSRLVLTTFLFDEVKIPSSFARAALEHHNEVLREVARSEKLLLIDLREAFDARGADREGFFFGDHYHPAWGGARFLATELAKGLRPVLAE